MKITVKPVNGEPFEIEGNDYRFENGVHYLAGQSFPDEIVEVKPQTTLAVQQYVHSD